MVTSLLRISILLLLAAAVTIQPAIAGDDKAGTSKAAKKARCSDLVVQVDAELKRANADTFADAGDYTRATSLLAGAALRQQFGRYDTCIQKAQRAHDLLAPHLKDAPASPPPADNKASVRGD